MGLGMCSVTLSCSGTEGGHCQETLHQEAAEGVGHPAEEI